MIKIHEDIIIADKLAKLKEKVIGRSLSVWQINELFDEIKNIEKILEDK